MTGPGAIALVGSGEYLPEMQALETALIDDAVARGKHRTYVQIPTAAGRESEKRLGYWRELGTEQGRRIGVETHFLPIYDRAAADDHVLAQIVHDAGLIYLSGGDPNYLADTLRGSAVGRAIEAHWRSGGALAGCSAGAMVMGALVPRFRLLSGSTATEGLNLLPPLRVIPHFNRLFVFAFSGFAASEVALGIEDLTALVRVSGSDAWHVEGRGAVHVLSGPPRAKLHAGEAIRF